MSRIHSLQGPWASEGLGEGEAKQASCGRPFRSIQFSFSSSQSGASDLLVMNCKEMGGEVVFAVMCACGDRVHMNHCSSPRQ